jgi:hypothetical protein
MLAQVTWEKGDALRPSTYAHLLAGAHGVAHTLGTLLPGAAYKEKLRSGDYLGFFSELARSASGGKVGGPNPLDESLQNKSYERINRDTGTCPQHQDQLVLSDLWPKLLPCAKPSSPLHLLSMHLALDPSSISPPRTFFDPSSLPDI